MLPAKSADCYYEKYTIQGFDLDAINKRLANRDYSNPIIIEDKDKFSCSFSISKTPLYDRYVVNSGVVTTKGACSHEKGGYFIWNKFCLGPQRYCVVANICCEELEKGGSCRHKFKLKQIKNNTSNHHIHETCKAPPDSSCYELEAYDDEIPYITETPALIDSAPTHAKSFILFIISLLPITI